MKKTMFAMLLLGSLTAGAGQDESAGQKAELKMLRATVNTRGRRIAKLEAENAKLAGQVKLLLQLCEKAGIAPPPVAPLQPASAPSDVAKGETYMYLGKPRPKVRFEALYRKYHDKIILVDGKYQDVGKALAGASEVLGVAEIGPVGTTPHGCKVMQVLGKDEALIVRPRKVKMYYSRRTLTGVGIPGTERTHETPKLLFHVKGVDRKGLVDGAEFKAKLVSIGTYRYTAVTGAASTVASYAVYTPLTKEQFADALAKGFQLVSYRAVRRRKAGGGMETKVVGTPVP